ncbi:sugar phosphate nucleotidyltransferase [Nannocystaceae bacterium ST9]
MTPGIPRAMILAAGFGTRLGELTAIRPKPMLPICGAPLVRWSVLWLRAQGIREIVINLHHLGEQIVAELGDGSSLGVAIAYSDEQGMILGTGGGLRQARPLLDDGQGTPIVVVNGKILTDLALAPLLAQHRAHDAEATMVLRRDGEGVWGGELAIDREGKLATFLGRTREGSTPTPEPMMFTGVHVIAPRFLDRVPAQGEQCIVRTAYRSLFESGPGIDAWVHEGYWWEHSTTARYLEGLANVLEGRVALPWAEAPLVGVDPSASLELGVERIGAIRIGANARIGAGAKIGPDVEIGAGASVAAGVTIERASVWPGARVDADLRDAVAT